MLVGFQWGYVAPQMGQPVGGLFAMLDFLSYDGNIAKWASIGAPLTSGYTHKNISPHSFGGGALIDERGGKETGITQLGRSPGGGVCGCAWLATLLPDGVGKGLRAALAVRDGEGHLEAVGEAFRLDLDVCVHSV